VVVGLAVFGLCLAMLATVQFATPALADNDGYYHMKMGLLMRQQGLAPDFVWLPLSILSPERFYNHHMLFQAYLGLFAGDGSAEALVLGAKLASVLMPALAFTAIWWLLRGQRVPWAALWAVGLCAISEAFLYRMSQPRAQSAALLVLALALHLLLQRRYLGLLPLGFLFVWLYNAFPLLLVLAAIYAAAALLTERELAWRAVLYPALGVALGLIVNPYFPQNLGFIVSHILPKVSDATATAVGNEWYPYRTETLLENSGGALGLWLAGVLAIGWRGRRFSRAQLTAFGASVLFGYMLFQSRRFVEYFPPFALIFAALAAGPLLDDWRSAAARLRPSLARAVHVALPLGMALALAALLARTLPDARALMAASRPATTFAGAATWLREHSPRGSMVFQTDWDDFPRLFFYNSNNVYTAGLDPTYLQLYDQELYELWVAITRGEVERPSDPIVARFGGAYVVSDLRHTEFLRRAADDPGLAEVFRDGDAVVFRVLQPARP
jgi:hypothetical protein